MLICSDVQYIRTVSLFVRYVCLWIRGTHFFTEICKSLAPMKENNQQCNCLESKYVEEFFISPLTFNKYSVDLPH